MTINAEAAVTSEGEKEFWANDDRFQFIAVECEGVVVYPNLYDNEAVGEGGENGGSDGFGLVQLCSCALRWKCKPWQRRV